MTYRVHYRISGWVEVEAKDVEDALDNVSDWTMATMIDNSIALPSLDLDEAEENV